MPTFQSSFLSFILHRFPLFQGDIDDVYGVRKRFEDSGVFFREHPGVAVKALTMDGVRGEWLVPKSRSTDKVLLYLHGGGWFMGSPRVYRALVSQIAFNAKIRAISVDYRLAPEHPFPAGLNDCLTAYRWLLDQGVPAKDIVIGGDSAGGNLSLAVLLALKEAGDPLPSSAFLLSPATDLALTGESLYSRASMDPMFSTMSSRGFNRIVDNYVAFEDRTNPLVSPLYGDLSGLPPLLIHVGDREILLDDSTRFAERALGAGVEAECRIWPGMFHVFHYFTPILPEAKRANRLIASFVNRNFARSSEERPWISS